eukprot:1503979-Ditylum_brightwellii.AAC.1
MEKVANKILSAVETKLSNFNAVSEINVIKNLSIEESHVMLDIMCTVILGAKEIVKMMRRTFDPSIAPLLHHYKKIACKAALHSNLDISISSTSSIDDTSNVRKQKSDKLFVDIELI